jgi:hypothetical protein
MTPANNWLRYRDTPRGARWELKQGLPPQEGDEGSRNAGTIYAEFAGNDAVERSLALLSSLTTKPKGEVQSSTSQSSEFEGYELPKLPDSAIGSGLLPFLESRRRGLAGRFLR